MNTAEKREEYIIKENTEKLTHFMYVPFTGLGMYGGFRGNRWLRNRIKIFKQFVVPSLLAQTSQNFVIWVSWREEERKNPQVKELEAWLKMTFEHSQQDKRIIFTYSGICFWDDKYEDKIAYDRLAQALHGANGPLQNMMADAKSILMTIQPSDDCYHKDMVSQVQSVFASMSHIQAVGYQRGYITNYMTGETRLYNPTTNPPFYTIKFPNRETFCDPLRHMAYTAIKTAAGKYRFGTPIPSHEYVGLALMYAVLEDRGFMVGTHGENISTVFNHPFAGESVKENVWPSFGLADAQKLTLPISLRKRFLRSLPPSWQRKLRYLVGERIVNRIYNFLRS